MNDEYFNHSNYEKRQTINSGEIWKIKEVIERESEKQYIVKVSQRQFDQFSDEFLVDFSLGLNILSRLTHPSIIKFYGYSPTNFKDEPKPMILMEYTKNGSLSNIFSLQYKNKTKIYLDETKKLIIIYGIAAAMSYLHSNNIILRDLNPENIFLDDFFYPKISGFQNSKEITDKNPQIKEIKVKGTSPYLAPEILNGLLYSKPSDVYSFSLVMYELMMNEKPFKKMVNIFDLMKAVINNKIRPEFNKPIPECYKRLIERCWSEDPCERPTFDEIVNLLKTNDEFITEKVDKNEFLNYVKLIDESEISYNRGKHFQQVDDLIKNRMKLFNKSEIEQKLKGLFDSKKQFNLDNFKLDQLQDTKSLYEIYDVIDKKTKVTFKARSYLIEIHNFSRTDIFNFCQEVNINIQLNHPSILNFIGYAQNNFKSQPKPVIVTENMNLNLNSILESEICQEDEKWTDTKKLINIYGIASAMSYLHAHGIIHRDLKPENIYLDNNLHPKISGFHLSTKVNEENKHQETEERNRIQEVEEEIKIQGTPAYLAPEIYSRGQYSPKSDVYSFSLIMYYIITNDKPFSDINDVQELKTKINDEFYRPTFKTPINATYQRIIERCWSNDPETRPTFDEIVTELQTNKEFITDTINEEEYLAYISFVDGFKATIEPSFLVPQLDEIINSKLKTFTDFHLSFGLINIYDTELNDISLLNNFINLGNFEIVSKTGKNYFYSTYEIKDKKTQSKYTAMMTDKIFSEFHKHEIFNFITELNIILQLNHPSILKVIGFNPINFYHLKSPAIITESTNKTLATMLEVVQKSEGDFGWTDTKKLINIYGIASAMSYLHAHGIIHRDLKPENINLDNNLHPKISGFHLSTRINEENKHQETEERNRIQEVEEEIKIQGTPAYLAPEIYSRGQYSPKSDVYSFSLIMYYIITNDKPFSDINDVQELKTKINDEFYRPTFKTPINATYQRIIERCWSNDPETRPTFDEIVTELQTNKEFITDTINEEEYKNYIKFIEESNVTFETKNLIHKIESLVKFNSWRFHDFDVKIHFKSIYDTETYKILFNLRYVNIKNYQKGDEIDSKGDYKLLNIIEKETGNKFTAQIFYEPIKDLSEETITLISSQIFNMLQLNHYSVEKFIGISAVDFKNKNKAIIVTENCSNGSLDKIIKLERKNENIPDWNETKKLINIFGIASGMLHVHSHGIIHCNLTSENIYLDDFMFPKITNFYNSKEIILCNSPIDEYKEYIPFDSPEVFKNNFYSKASDVYAFAMIMYHIITGQKPFKDAYNWQFDVTIGKRPTFDTNTPDCYRKLIEKCWSQDPNERPTFEEIVSHLKNNTEFISDNVNKEEYENYIHFIEGEHFESNKQIKDLYDPVKSKTCTFRKVYIDTDKAKPPKKTHFSINMGSIDLSTFQKNKKIGFGSFGKVYKAIEKETENVYAAKVSILEMDSCEDSIIIDLCREVDIMSDLKHQAILNFIGYSPFNFKNKPKPVIMTELASYGSLDKIIEKERNCCGDHSWNDTKRLINIYGIASGMAYIHDHLILHRDLKPANILLDEFLYPKIADFGLSKNILDKSNSDDLIASGFKGTYAYSAPEIVFEHHYSFAGDVYAFGMIVYEIMTNESIFYGCNLYQLMKLLKENYRPEFKYPIPYCYKKLIEKCWSEDYNKRPAFDQIVDILENDENFITENVDEEEYLNYIYFIKDSLGKTEKQEEVNFKKQEEKHQNLNTQKSTPVTNNSQKIEETENENQLQNDCFIDLNKFNRNDIIDKSDFSKYYKLKEIGTDLVFIGQISMIEIKSFSNEEIENLKKDLNLISQFKHSSLLNFIGYSPIDFKNERKPVIITENSSNCSLKEILELNRLNKNVQGWDETKKLINIFGIASGMSYLHSYGIVHRCLRPENIFLDDVLSPKIGDFGLSTRFIDWNSITQQSIAGMKMSPTFSAPEVLQSNAFSKASDVYSFAFIVFEILSDEIPFNEIDNNNRIVTEVVINNKRPKLKDSIPDCFKKLIESCWSQNPNERPSFDDIVYELKMNPEFMIDKVSKDDYLEYIKFVEENQKAVILDQIGSSNKSKIQQKIQEESNEQQKHEESSQNLQKIQEDPSEKQQKQEELNEQHQEESIPSTQKIQEDSSEKQQEEKVINEQHEETSENPLIIMRESSNEQPDTSSQTLGKAKDDFQFTHAREIFVELRNAAAITDVENQGYHAKFMNTESERGDVESLKFLAKKYSKENDAENTYKYMKLLIQSNDYDVPLEYAVILYNSKYYAQAFNYFTLLAKVNHPIANYFIAVMKFYGLGCDMDKRESKDLMIRLSSNGIDKATEFLKDHF